MNENGAGDGGDGDGRGKVTTGCDEATPTGTRERGATVKRLDSRVALPPVSPFPD